MNLLVVVFALIACSHASKFFIDQTPSRAHLVPPAGQNISLPGYTYATSAYQSNGLLFITTATVDSTILMAFNNDTLQFVQKEEIDSCFNPQFFGNSGILGSFFLLCSSDPVNGIPVAWLIRPVQNIFFRVVTSTSIGGFGPGNWTWIAQQYSNYVYIWNQDSNAISYIYASGSSSPYIYSSTVTYNFGAWQSDFAGFTWTNVAVISQTYTNLVLTGHMQGINVLAIISSNPSGTYSVISGTYDAVGILYNGGSQIIGYTNSTSGSNTVLSIWDFSGLSYSKPVLLVSGGFSSPITTTIGPNAYASNFGSNIFVSQQIAGILSIYELSWSTFTLTSKVYYNAPESVIAPAGGFAADLWNFYIFNVGYVTMFPYVY